MTTRAHPFSGDFSGRRADAWAASALATQTGKETQSS